MGKGRGQTLLIESFDCQIWDPIANMNPRDQMPDAKTSSRSTRLRALPDKILAGKDTITMTNAKLFLEAISDQPESTLCIQRLAGSPDGHRALQSSLSFDTSPAFLNGPITSFLRYLEAEELKTICGGEVLRQVVLNVVENVLTWNSLVEAVTAKKLSENRIEAFSWLLLQLVSLPTEQAITYTTVARDEGIQQELLGCSQLQVRQRAQRIMHKTSNMSAKREPNVCGPGGRHDNDFGDIRKISILPTADELASKDPFLPRSADIENCLSRADGLAFYADGQFWLLREDMMRDLREEIQIFLEGRKGNWRGFSVENLSMLGVLHDDRQPWSLQLRCLQDLPPLQGKSETKRKRFIQESVNFMKHESLTCLVADGDIVTLGVLVRDEDLLAQIPPILNVRIPIAAIDKTLARLKSAREISLVQLNAALFAYEPVLKQLQEIKELSLEEDLLCWEQGKNLPITQLSTGW